MSKSSKLVTVSIPLRLMEIFSEHLQPKHLRDYLREAFAEKLMRDFDVVIDKKDVTRKFGERVDLRGKSRDELKLLAERFRVKKDTPARGRKRPATARKKS